MMKKDILAALMTTLFMGSASYAALLHATDSSRTQLNNADDGSEPRVDTVKSDSSKLTVRPDAKALKSWIEFDISEVDVGALTDARLRVTLHADRGVMSCDLSAVNDSVTTNYVELDGTVTWNTAPGNYTSANGISPDAAGVTTNELRQALDTNLTTFVGSISSTNGLAGDQFFFIDVLPILQADTDGYVLFALHNSGGNTDFATHDHSSGADYWPALELTGLPESDPGELYNVQLNYGDGENTYVGAAQIGAIGDAWNNPVWVGVTNGSGSSVVFSGETLLDSTGADNGVFATLTATFGDTNGWNNSGTFDHYSSRDDGSANPLFMERVVKINNVPDVNPLTLSLGGLPTNTTCSVYLYGSGNKHESGYIGSLAAANQNGGFSSATIMYDTTHVNAATGRDVTLSTSQGLSWEVLTGTTDSSGNLSIDIVNPDVGNAANQIFLTGVQVQLDLPIVSPTVPPVITSIEVSGSDVTLTWTDEGIGTYTIQSKTGLAAATWNDVLGGLPAGLGSTNFTSTGPDQEFYQIKGE